MSKQNDGVFALLDKADGETRVAFLANLSAIRKVSVETLEAEFGKWREDNAAKLEKLRKAEEREALKLRLEALSTEAEGMTLDSEGLADFISRVEAETGMVRVRPDMTLEVTLPTVRKGGTGGGKPAADAPQPYLDSEGDRILGPLTVWAKANLTEAEQTAAGCFRPNGKFRTGTALGKALIKAEILTASPVE
jgi:hypothetical protein